MSIVKSLSVGEGDMFYIKHNSDNFTIIDCCMSDESQDAIVKELEREATGKNIRRFISTHPDDDHIDGLKYLNQKMEIFNFYCVKNGATKEDETEDFDEYCTLRDSEKKAFYLEKDCSRLWMNQGNAERGSAGLNILWPKTDNKDYKEELKNAENGESPNNISIILRYSLEGGASILWMGDLETEFMEKIIDEIELPKTDILFAPHHGRNSGKVPDKWLKQIDPKIVIIGEAPSQHLNYYPGYNKITQNSAGDIVFDCVQLKVHIYVSNDEYSVDFLEDEGLPDSDLGHYIGTLLL